MFEELEFVHETLLHEAVMDSVMSLQSWAGIRS